MTASVLKTRSKHIEGQHPPPHPALLVSRGLRPPPPVSPGVYVPPSTRVSRGLRSPPPPVFFGVYIASSTRVSRGLRSPFHPCLLGSTFHPPPVSPGIYVPPSTRVSRGLRSPFHPCLPGSTFHPPPVSPGVYVPPSTRVSRDLHSPSTSVSRGLHSPSTRVSRGLHSPSTRVSRGLRSTLHPCLPGCTFPPPPVFFGVYIPPSTRVSRGLHSPDSPPTPSHLQVLPPPPPPHRRPPHLSGSTSPPHVSYCQVSLREQSAFNRFNNISSLHPTSSAPSPWQAWKAPLPRSSPRLVPLSSASAF